MIKFIKKNFWAKIGIGFVLYMMMVGFTHAYIIQYNPSCNTFHPEQRLRLSAGEFLPALYWPAYWPFQLARLVSGWESTCASDPLIPKDPK